MILLFEAHQVIPTFDFSTHIKNLHSALEYSVHHIGHPVAESKAIIAHDGISLSASKAATFAFNDSKVSINSSQSVDDT